MQQENVLEMDRQFDFRALLLKIQDRLSNDDRRRLHFLVGDIIPRMQREDVTLGGTLTVLESLFDRAVINEGDLNFLIRIFREIQCYDVVKRLQGLLLIFSKNFISLFFIFRISIIQRTISRTSIDSF